MSNNIVLKNNQISGVVPSPDELVIGEVALNTADGILYTKKNDGTVVPTGAGDILIPLVQSVAGKIGNVVLSKNDVGLENIDNTSDMSKPVSTAQANADIAIQQLAAQDASIKMESAKEYAVQRSNHIGTQSIDTIDNLSNFIENINVQLENLTESVVFSVNDQTGDVSLDKNDIGLQNVDNTSDLDKPISTAVNNALASKASVSHNHSLPNENTNIGRSALIGNTTGYRNTSIGCDAMSFNTIGFNNTALGSPALWQNINGFNNTSIGSWNMVFNTSGNENTAIGTGALSNNVNGSNNTSIGTACLFNNTTGLNNTSIGTFSSIANTTGSNNTIVGFAASMSGGDLSNCIVLGSNAVAQKSGELVLGSALNSINTSSTVGIQGNAMPLPSRPLGYLEIRLNNQLVKIPYYNLEEGSV